MQSSYGESQIMVNGSTVGLVRVLGTFPMSALYPRLGVRLGITLRESDAEFLSGRPHRNYSVRVARGEWRVREHDGVVGPIYAIGPHDAADSSAHGHERQIEVACDLDEVRLEQIEEIRNGGPVTFWLALWPAVTDSTGPLPLGVQFPPVRIEVPRDAWIHTLSKFRRRRIALLEVPFPSEHSARFETAIDHVKHAHERIHVGEYDEAFASCRRAIEALGRSLRAKSGDQVTELLNLAVGARQAKAYSSIYSQAKELANVTVHRSGPEPLYSRVEARFVVNLTEQLIVLFGTLATPTQVDAA